MNNTTPSTPGEAPEPQTPQQDSPTADAPTVIPAEHAAWQPPGVVSDPAPGAQAGPYGSAAFQSAGGGPDNPAGQVGYGQTYAPSASAPSYGTWPEQSAPTQRAGRGRNTLVAVAALALLSGGIGGGVAGYLAGDSASGPGRSSFDSVPAAKSVSEAPPGSVQAVAEKVTPSVVQLRVEGRGGAGSGSGVVIGQEGAILTNNHVIEAATEGGRITAVFSDGSEARATILGRAPSADLAVVKAEGAKNLRPAEFGRSADLAVGQPVVAIGSPFRLSGTVTSGIVSALNRPVSARNDQEGVNTVLNAIQTDAAINPGNSGGPLTDMQGRIIGINSAIYSPGGEAQAGSVGLGFAIPIDSARRIAKELQEKGQATQAVLGVSLAPTDQNGATVSSVVPGSAADAAGIKAGDVIISFGDRRVDSREAVVAAVRSRPPGDKVSIKISSGGSERTVEATLGSEVIGGGG